MKYFQTPEANSFFSLVILVEKTISRLEKKLHDKDITIENYVTVRQEIEKIFNKAEEEIEKKSTCFIGKKALHFPKEQNRSKQ